jgi:hypothetical protein
MVLPRSHVGTILIVNRNEDMHSDAFDVIPYEVSGFWLT